MKCVIDELLRKRVKARNTRMPYDNTDWGKEKVEKLLVDLIACFEEVNKNKEVLASVELTELNDNLEYTLKSMPHNLTKLYAFFCDGEWSTIDSGKIINDGLDGLNDIKRIYNK